LLIIAGITGVIVGFLVWCGAAYFVVAAVTSIETRRPDLAGSKTLRAFEIAASSAVVLASLSVGFWVARTLWLQWR